MNRIRIILSYILGLILSICLVILALIFISKKTILDKSFISRLFDENNYYENVYNSINEDILDYMTSSGLESEVLESVILKDNQFTLTPSKHFSGRNPLKMNNTVFGGIYIKNDNYSVYYTGDGGYSKFFKEVYEKFGETDLMFAESGQYNKNWADHHMFPNQTVTACKDANARWFVPVHWGAFVLSTHAWNEPPEKTTEYAKEMGLNIATPRIGQLVDYDNIGEYQEKWWE